MQIARNRNLVLKKDLKKKKTKEKKFLQKETPTPTPTPSPRFTDTRGYVRRGKGQVQFRTINVAGRFTVSRDRQQIIYINGKQNWAQYRSLRTPYFSTSASEIASWMRTLWWPRTANKKITYFCVINVSLTEV